MHVGISNSWNLDGRVTSYALNTPGGYLDPVQEWLEMCAVGHLECKTSNDSRLPTRVIDVGNAGAEMIQLLETKENKGQYICLSYCWGKIAFIKTTNENFDAHRAAISLSDMCQSSFVV